MSSNQVHIPECQRERNELFLDAVRAGRSDLARALVVEPWPADATEAELERWKTRRRLYRRRTTASRT